MIALVLALLLLAGPAQAQAIGFMGFDALTSSDALTTITTKTVSGATSIQFTGLNSTTYDTYFLNCSGLLASVDGTFFLRVGEGAGPTWETGAFYTNEYLYVGNSVAGVNAVNSTTSDAVIDGQTNSTTTPQSMRVWIDNVGSTTMAKNIIWENLSFTDPGTSGEFILVGSSYWNADTNAITGLELVASTGNITGTCTLYGVVK